mmetsp:Transcript_1681/g.5234  ORF Transcript_1681/g.5234 Transcript_1681/m.5234 type:complete len:193 (+) Transcript_1681:145-723(+)
MAISCGLAIHTTHQGRRRRCRFPPADVSTEEPSSSEEKDCDTCGSLLTSALDSAVDVAVAAVGVLLRLPTASSAGGAAARGISGAVCGISGARGTGAAAGLSSTRGASVWILPLEVRIGDPPAASNIRSAGWLLADSIGPGDSVRYNPESRVAIPEGEALDAAGSAKAGTAADGKACHFASSTMPDSNAGGA